MVFYKVDNLSKIGGSVQQLTYAIMRKLVSRLLILLSFYGDVHILRHQGRGRGVTGLMTFDDEGEGVHGHDDVISAMYVVHCKTAPKCTFIHERNVKFLRHCKKDQKVIEYLN